MNSRTHSADTNIGLKRFMMLMLTVYMDQTQRSVIYCCSLQHSLRAILQVLNCKGVMQFNQMLYYSLNYK